MDDVRRAAYLRYFAQLDEIGQKAWGTDLVNRLIITYVHNYELATGRSMGQNVSALARATGLPVETTRRRVNALIADGILAKEARGIVMADWDKATVVLDLSIALLETTCNATLSKNIKAA